MKARIWPIVGVLAVAALWAASAYANYLAGLALADDERMRYVLGAASVACDVLKGVALFMIIALALRKRWVAAGVAVMIFALCTAWSLRSAVYFAADAMGSKISRLENQNRVADAKLKIIDLKSQRAEFLSGQSVEVFAQNKFARREALAANKETGQEFRALVGEVENGVKELESRGIIMATVDPIAAATGADPKLVVLASSVFFAILLEMCSSWGFWLVARAREPHHPGEASPQEVAIVLEPSPPPYAPALPVTPVPRAEIAPPKPEKAPQAPALAPPRAENVVDSDEARIIRALQQVLEEAPTERVLLSVLSGRLNEVLPPYQQLHNRHMVTQAVTPALHRAFPNAEKRRAAGQVWIAGVKFRRPDESANVIGSKA